MTSVHDLAAYIVRTRGSMDSMKLQKLLYYVQAWALAWEGRPVFRERIQAWREGPVVREMYEEHRGKYKVTEHTLGDERKLSKDDIAIADAVLDFYAKLSARKLSALTHSERPWVEARRGVGREERSNVEIDRETMRAFYRSLESDRPMPPGDVVLAVEFDQEVDGRWIADVPDLPGVLVYGDSWADAWVNVRKLARKVLEDRVKHGEAPPDVLRASLVPAT